MTIRFYRQDAISGAEVPRERRTIGVIVFDRVLDEETKHRLGAAETLADLAGIESPEVEPAGDVPAATPGIIDAGLIAALRWLGPVNVEMVRAQVEAIWLAMEQVRLAGQK